MSAIPPYGAEERWRRTVDNRHRPLKLKVGRLLREFGYARLDPEVSAAIEARLERVGLRVQPPLHTVAGDQIITLELLRPTVAGAPYEPPPPATNDFAAVPAPEVYQPFVDPPAQGRLLDVDQYTPDCEQARLVRAAVEAEQRAREAYDHAAAAAADRIAALERELAAERQAKARSDDQSIDIRQRIDLEREDATARLADLAASERAASDQVDAERARISDGEERRRRPFADVDGPIERALSEDHGGAGTRPRPRPRRPGPSTARSGRATPEPSAPASERVSWHPAPVVVASDQIAPERLPREGRARLGMLLVGLVALAAIAAAGYAVGHGDEPSAPAAAGARPGGVAGGRQAALPGRLGARVATRRGSPACASRSRSRCRRATAGAPASSPGSSRTPSARTCCPPPCAGACRPPRRRRSRSGWATCRR